MSLDAAGLVDRGGRRRTPRRRWIAPAVAVSAPVVPIAALGLRQPPIPVPAVAEPPSPEGTTLTLHVNSNEGHCSRALFDFAAELQLPGQEGAVSYRLEGPNLELQSGGTAPGIPTDGNAVLKAGWPDRAIGRNFLITGNVATRGDMVFHLVTPIDRRSEAVHIDYLCP